MNLVFSKSESQCVAFLVSLSTPRGDGHVAFPPGGEGRGQSAMESASSCFLITFFTPCSGSAPPIGPTAPLVTPHLPLLAPAGPGQRRPAL